MSKEVVGVSLNPSDFVEGGGLLNDVDVIVKQARFTIFDYDGKADPVPALEIMFDTGDKELIKQCWSMGKVTDWQPSKDGHKLVPIGKATGIVRTSNGGMFFESMVNAGVPADLLSDGDISKIEGMELHVIRVDVKREGLQLREGQRQPQVLIVDKLISLPGGEKSGKGTSKRGKAATPAVAKAASPATTPVTSSSASTDDETIAVEAVQGVLAANDGEITRSALLKQVLAFVQDKTGDTTLAKRITKLAYDNAFLDADGRPWMYADGVLTSME